jgi:hypothetical protein
MVYYINVKYIHLNSITKFLSSFNHPFNYIWLISTTPLGPARSPLFGPDPSPAKSGSMRVRVGPARISGSSPDRKLSTVGWPGTVRLPHSPSNPLFSLNRAYRADLTRLGPLLAGLGQGNEPAGLNGSTRFSNRAWQAGLHRVRVGRSVWPSLHSTTPNIIG